MPTYNLGVLVVGIPKPVNWPQALSYVDVKVAAENITKARELAMQAIIDEGQRPIIVISDSAESAVSDKGEE